MIAMAFLSLTYENAKIAQKYLSILELLNDGILDRQLNIVEQ